MPKMGNIGIANASAFGYTTSIGKGFFIAAIGNTAGPGWRPTNIKVDSSGYIYVSAYDDTGSTKSSYVVKISPTGNFIYSKKLSATSINVQMYSMDLDSSGNIYVAGVYTATSGGYYKLDNSSTTILASSAISLTGPLARCVAVDNSGNIYVSGNYTAGTSPTSRTFFVKYNSSGSMIAQRGLVAPLTTYSNAVPQNCIIDKTTGTLYTVVAQTNNNNQTYYIQTKFDSSLTTFNYFGQVFLSSTTSGYGGRVGGIDYDSDGNVYMVGSTTTTSTSFISAWVAKYNSSMSTQTWQYIYRGTTGYTAIEFNQVRIDRTTNDVYVMGQNLTAVGNKVGYLTKYTSAGVMQWERYFYCPNTGTSAIWDMAFDGNAFILIAQSTITGLPMIVARLPKDGSKTGTYTVAGASVVYEVNSILSTTRTMSSQSYNSQAITSTATAVTSPTIGNASPTISSSTVIT